MFIIENGKIQGQKSLNIGKIRVINLAFKGDFAFADDDKFKLVLGDIQSENFGFTNNGYIGFSYINLAEIIKKENTDLSVKVTCNGSQILSDSITITAYVQGGGSGEEIQGIVFNAFPINQSTEVKITPPSFTKNTTSFKETFNCYYSLITVSQLDTSNGTDFSNMFYRCNSLTSIPQIDTSNGTKFKFMFYLCNSLTSVPQLDTSNGTDFGSMFSNCEKLTSVPQLDTSNGTDFSSMFSTCKALTSIPQLDTSNGTKFSSMFSFCNSLTSVPQLDTSNGTDFGAMFGYCRALTDFGGLLNVKFSFDLGVCQKLTHNSLLNVLNGLADLTGSTSQKLTLGTTNLAKLTDEEKAIATNKNWTLA